MGLILDLLAASQTSDLQERREHFRLLEREIRQLADRPRQKPPNLRNAVDPNRACATCEFLDLRRSTCVKFDYQVALGLVCDAWEEPEVFGTGRPPVHVGRSALARNDTDELYLELFKRDPMTTLHNPMGDIERGWTLPADVAEVDFTHHAVEQANVRVFRRLDAEFSAHDVHALLPTAYIRREPPDWHWGERIPKPKAYLISDDPRIAFPLEDLPGHPGAYLAITALTEQDDRPVGASVRGLEKLADLLRV